MLAPPTASSGEWRGNLDAHTGASKVRGAILALLTMLRRGSMLIGDPLR